jgi:GAF domain-containing protein
MMAGWTGPSDEDVHTAITEVCAARDLDSLLVLARQAARRLTGADGVSVVLRAGNNCYYADEDSIAPLWKGQRFPLEACISGWVMLNKQSILIPDIYADARVPHDVYRPTFVKSLLMVPVLKEEPVAAIGAYWKQEAAPTASDVALVELLAEAMSIGLKREQACTRIQDWLRNR